MSENMYIEIAYVWICVNPPTRVCPPLQPLLDCVELYNTKEEKWEKTDIKLTEPKYYFGFQTIKLSEIISKH